MNLNRLWWMSKSTWWKWL